ncbi:hypothetical protein CARUB_v10028697mg [Capsella rubella]|uniref:Uncharacterized protein n=1 Tax=Capsella rubella TaxID=81985 RepID=R0G8B2_9BRAS|nr:hypothetical protein CARUB_v10028697mg [Capsella rubella]
MDAKSWPQMFPWSQCSCFVPTRILDNKQTSEEKKKKGPVRPPRDHPGKVEPSRVTILYSTGCIRGRS